MKEADLKRTIEAYLGLKQNLGELVYFRLNAGAFPTQAGRWARGVPAGTSDFIVIGNNGRHDAPNKAYPMVYFLELKSDKGKQSDIQKAFQEMVQNQYCEYHIIRSLEDLEGVI